MSTMGSGNVHGLHWTKDLAVDFIHIVTRAKKEEIEKMNGKTCIKIASELKVILWNVK